MLNTSCRTGSQPGAGGCSRARLGCPAAWSHCRGPSRIRDGALGAREDHCWDRAGGGWSVRCSTCTSVQQWSWVLFAPDQQVHPLAVLVLGWRDQVKGTLALRPSAQEAQVCRLQLSCFRPPAEAGHGCTLVSWGHQAIGKGLLTQDSRGCTDVSTQRSRDCTLFVSLLCRPWVCRPMRRISRASHRNQAPSSTTFPLQRAMRHSSMTSDSTA